jgi:hypothetical protein
LPPEATTSSATATAANSQQVHMQYIETFNNTYAVLTCYCCQAHE